MTNEEFPKSTTAALLLPRFTDSYLDSARPVMPVNASFGMR